MRVKPSFRQTSKNQRGKIMKRILLTIAATAAIIAGSFTVPDQAEAQRWRRGWYGRPYANSYYRPYYSRNYYYPRYYRGYYSYPRYYSYPYRYYGYGPGVYLGSRNAGFYYRF
jgi:hypothetical protein